MQVSGCCPDQWVGKFITCVCEEGRFEMAEGTIRKLAEKGFGFISSDTGDVFFHMSALVDVQFEELNVGQNVQYEIGEGPKGPRAENVRVV